MPENRDYLELAYRSIYAFADDGRLDEDELDKLLEVALRDGIVDENETRVLRDIFSRLKGHEITQAMRDKVHAVEKKFNINIISSGD
jgi:hypothetical protein